jgi:hypothetical protein
MCENGGNVQDGAGWDLDDYHDEREFHLFRNCATAHVDNSTSIERTELEDKKFLNWDSYYGTAAAVFAALPWAAPTALQHIKKIGPKESE